MRVTWGLYDPYQRSTRLSIGSFDKGSVGGMSMDSLLGSDKWVWIASTAGVWSLLWVTRVTIGFASFSKWTSAVRIQALGSRVWGSRSQDS